MRKGGGGRPLNSVVMRHKRIAWAVASIGMAAASTASACSCPIASPEYRLPEAEVVFLAEVTTVELSAPRDRGVSTVPVALRVIESIKGVAPEGANYLELPPEAPCSANFKVGERRLILLRNESQRLIGLCNTIYGGEEYVSAFRNAVKGSK